MGKAYVAVGEENDWTGLVALGNTDPEDLGVEVLNCVDSMGVELFKQRLLNSNSWAGFTGEKSQSWGNGPVRVFNSDPLTSRFLYLVDVEKEYIMVFKSMSFIIPRGVYQNNRENVVMIIDGKPVRGVYYGNMACWFQLIKFTSPHDILKNIKMTTMSSFIPEMERKFWDFKDNILVIRSGIYE